MLLYTAQRRSDVVRMGRQHIKDGVLMVKQQKPGATLAIPVHPHLQAVLDATPSEHLTFLVTANSASTQGGFSRAKNLPICQSCSRPSSNSSSISKPPR